LNELATDTVVKVNDTVTERVVRQRFVRACAAGERSLSSTHGYWMNEQVAIVHHTRPEGLTRDLRAFNHQISRRRILETSDLGWFETPLEPGVGGPDRVQGR
jgi:hypothetical protein